jgi:hypothetical protein
MAKKITRSRPWTKEEVRMLKMFAREKTKTTVIACKLTERGCGVSAGIKAGRDARRRSREERGVKLFDEEASKPDPLKHAAVLAPVKAKPFGWPRRDGQP